VADNYSSLGVDGIRWAASYINNLIANSINVVDNLVPVNDNYSNLGLDTNRWATSYITSLNANSISVVDNLVPVNDNYSNLGSSLMRWRTAHIQDISASNISISGNIVPVISNQWVLMGQDIDGELGNDQSGWSVSLNAAGTRVAIGAHLNDGTSGIDRGHVRVYEYRGSDASWIQLGRDIDGELPDDRSGFSVSLNAAGTIVAIGANLNDGRASSAGHVRVYQYNNSASDPSWIQLGLDIDGKFGGDKSGISISLNDAGTIVAIGALLPVNFQRGQVKVYQYRTSDTSWIQLGLDIDGESDLDESGYSISLNASGTILAIGAIKNDGIVTNSDRGHVRVYQYRTTDTSWIQLGRDIDGELAGDQFGYSVSLSSSGTIVAIGAPFNDGRGSNSGHVRVYQYRTSDTSWIQLGLDIDGELTLDQSGFSVSLNATGTRIAIGAPFNNGLSGSDRGHVRVYEYRTTDTSWIQIGLDIDGELSNDQSGYSVSLNASGTRVAIGALFNDGTTLTDRGHVRIYELNNRTSLGTATNIWSSAYIQDLTIDTINGLTYGGSTGTSNVVLTTSDDRIKHNEVIINNGLYVVDQLAPKFYQKTQVMLGSHHNGDLTGYTWTYEAGLIAQELLQISDLSYVVNGGDYYDSNNMLIQETYSVNYNSVFIYGLAAIKELHQKVKAQETTILSLQISMLEQQTIINSLITRIQALESSV